MAQDSQVCNGVAGHNANSLHVSYIGGQHTDDRTEAQNISLIVILRQWKTAYPDAEILGHRDFPGVRKECPRFDVKKWLLAIGFNN
jgi:N-acetylmuramoyl-L-alanine amidase